MDATWNRAAALEMRTDSARQELFLAQLEQHKRILHKIARAYCGNRSDRDDLVQETIVQLWRSFGSFDERARFSTWMYGVALNVAISFVRREGRRGVRVAPQQAVLLEELPAREPDERTGEAELLEREIERLGDFDKALVLLYLDGNEYSTIAVLLGISVSNVGTRLSRLKARLAECLGGASPERTGKEGQMNLDELQRMWAEHDKRLDQSLRLNVQLLREVHLVQARSVLGRLRWMIGFEFATDALLVLWFGSYAVDQLSTARFAIPGALLFLVWTGFLALSLRQLERASTLDYGGPVAAMQRQLESLRVLRTRNTKWRLLLAPALWTPLVIVVLQAFFGVDAWKVPGTGWVLANALAGTALSPALFWVCRRYADRLLRIPRVQGIVNNVSGRCLARARARLDAIAEFEREGEPGAA